MYVHMYVGVENDRQLILFLNIYSNSKCFRAVQYFDNIVYPHIFSIIIIQCFPICYHDNCFRDCERV